MKNIHLCLKAIPGVKLLVILSKKARIIAKINIGTFQTMETQSKRVINVVSADGHVLYMVGVKTASFARKRYRVI